MQALEQFRSKWADFINIGSSTPAMRLSSLAKQKIDFEVYLPALKCNLQRPFVWTAQQEEELILSMLIGRTIQPLAFICRYNETLEVIDGKQRLNAMLRFYENRFSIELFGEYYFFTELPPEFMRAIRDFPVRHYVANEGSEPLSDEFKRDWFFFINFAGTPQEQAHFEKLKGI